MTMEFEITPQPDDMTCGPACLHAVYRYYGDDISLDRLGEEVRCLPGGGTLAVMLGLHALRHGYDVTIYTCNLLMFDPSWFGPNAPHLQDRLREQAKAKQDPKLREATAAYLEFLNGGGQIRMQDITATLMNEFLKRDIPIIVGLSATWLYKSMRERPADLEFDDTRGEPTGHFVVVHGCDLTARRADIADPYCHQPYPGAHRYSVDIDRLLGAILLGIVTYDAKLLIVTPRDQTAGTT